MSFATSDRAKRKRGVCRGALWRQERGLTARPSATDSSRSYDYCVMVGCQLSTYENTAAYERGDHPTMLLRIVGASAWNPSGGTEGTAATSFRLVTDQGTHVYCAAPSAFCRDVWLGALHAGLDRSLVEAALPKTQPLQPPQPQKTNRLRVQRQKKYCISCGALEDPSPEINIVIQAKSVPVPHYAKESRCDMCSACLVAQGLLHQIYLLKELYASAQHERKALLEAKRLCLEAMRKANPTLEGGEEPKSTTAKTKATADATTPTAATTEASGATTTTTTGEATHESSSSSSNGSSKESSGASSWSVVDDPLQSQSWIHLPPTPESTKAVLKLMTSSADFLSLQRVSLTLETCCKQIQEGVLGVPDLLEQIDQVTGTKTIFAGNELDQHAEMKKQAFRAAGDMGTAMKLLLDLALPRTPMQQHKTDTNVDLFVCLLEFLLDLCQDGELASVAAFWPQLCHIHLCMLPADDTASMIRIELLEDFLLTVSARHSIHLGLDLIWSHTADLEESLFNPGCAIKCRRRRFSVMRFVCELESLLFGFSNVWGGGAVSLRKWFSPSNHQDALMKQYMAELQELRKEAQPQLTRSVRLELLIQSKLEMDPEQAVQEALRVARNADYFSSHMNFTRRLCDVAERLRFLELGQRASALEEELALLNASGTMGGDPLNRVLEHHIRVVGVPVKEGHVFRSKERTPVLLLMEVFDDTVEDKDVADTDSKKLQREKSERELQEAHLAAETAHNEKGLVAGDASAEGTTALASAEQGEQAVSETNDAVDHGEGQDLDTSYSSLEPKKPLSDANIGHDEDEMYSPKHLTRDRAKTWSHSSPIKPPSLPLEGSLEESNIPQTPHALKRFDNVKSDAVKDHPSTPTIENVEEMVSHAMVKQLHLPDLEKLGQEGKESNKGVSPEKKSVEGTLSPDETEYSNSEADKTLTTVDTAIDNSGRSSKKMSSLAVTPKESGQDGSSYAPLGDVRRDVLNAIFLKARRGDNAIAAETQAAVQLSLQELEHKRAAELLMHDSSQQLGEDDPDEQQDTSYVEVEKAKRKMSNLSMDGNSSQGSLEEDAMPGGGLSEEDEALESIRLLLIQNRVAQGNLDPVAAAKVLQNASIQKVRTDTSGSDDIAKMGDIDAPRVDAGDVDPRLVGCGDLPPAVLQALTLWKAGMVTNGELLELVKKDLEHGRHAISQDPEVVDKLKEDSAFWGRFAFGERWAEKKARIALSSPHGKRAGWDLSGVIVKSNDDLRQERFVMQLIELCQEAFQVAGLELWVHPYRIISTGRTTGIIEMVRNAMSFDALKKRPGYGKGGLREHFERMTEFTPDPKNAFKAAQANFVRSLAAYSLMSYFFMFKDRHNGNILLDTAGHVIHIDFGFVFGIAPGGSFSLEMSTPFKLTEEMMEVMGGMKSPLFSEFVTLFCCGFLALQAHSETFLTLVEITSKDSTFNCFEGKDSGEVVEKLRERFCTDLNAEKTIAFALDLIQQATSSYGTKQYDYFQYISQGIAA